MLGPTARLAEALSLPFHSGQTVELLTDKSAQRRRLHEAGVDMVRTHPLAAPDDWEQAVRHTGLPAVVKPARGEGSRSTVRIDDEDSGRRIVTALLATESGLIVEELLRGVDSHPYGDYVSVESAACRDGVFHYAVTGKFPLVPPFRETGQFWPSHLPDGEEAAVTSLVDRAVRALGVTRGLVHTEVKMTPEGPRIIEVNGRLGGHQAELAHRAAGLDLITLAGEIALDRSVRPERIRPDRVCFQLSTPGPTERCTLRRITGAAQVRALPGISLYRPSVRPGGTVEGGPATRFLDLTCGEAPDHRAMTALVAQVVALLSFDFEIDGQPVARTAGELFAGG
ncbi:hypothetical protein ACZ90_14185 [Streptomyces albus subsp. albus]|nr:hypothetical protein ACZ90_14185 [Streptomyces albus subsp. albus]